MQKAIAIALVSICGFAQAAIAGPDEDAVRDLLHSTFDKSDNRLVVEPVVIAGNYAIAGWTQSDMGGRALLQSKHGNWALILCAGDGIKSAEALRQAGLSNEAANALSRELSTAEEKVPADRLAMFAKFEGLVRMDDTGNHPPVHHQKH